MTMPRCVSVSVCVRSRVSNNAQVCMCLFTPLPPFVDVRAAVDARSLNGYVGKRLWVGPLTPTVSTVCAN